MLTQGSYDFPLKATYSLHVSMREQEIEGYFVDGLDEPDLGQL
jgi:hypothetical protein